MPNSLEKALDIISKMDKRALCSLQWELQYALKYWNIGFHWSQRYIQWEDGGDHTDTAVLFYTDGIAKCQIIAESPLYVAVRGRIRELFPEEGSNLPTNWTGWAGLEDDQWHGINVGIEAIIKAKMPVALMSNKNTVYLQELNIQSFGIRGMFVENPTYDGLIAKFNECFSEKTAAAKLTGFRESVTTFFGRWCHMPKKIAS